MMTSSSPCFFHSSRMYSASSLLRFDPATWDSAVKMRCWRRSSSGVGMDLNLDSTSVSWAAEVGVKPRMVFWALEIGPQRRANARTKQPMPLGSFIEFTGIFDCKEYHRG